MLLFCHKGNASGAQLAIFSSVFIIKKIYQELIGNYIYMEEYFMRETVMKVSFL